MDFAVNYSAALADLVDRGDAAVDCYKCPAWPDLIDGLTDAGAEDRPPVYIHFPMRVGMGTGAPINSETGETPDWDQFDHLLAQTGTPWVSAHMGPQPEDHPGLTERPWAEQLAGITEALIRDIEPLVERFGPDRVVGENIFEFFGMHLRASVIPDVLCTVVETTGCGLLLDLSHARIAAMDLGVDPYDYISALPVSHLREIHMTGIQTFGEFWVTRLRDAGIDAGYIEKLEGRWIDHLPMTEDDWSFFDWALGRIRSGAWREPEIIAFEYGGVGPEFEALTVPEVLAEQVPRLYDRVHGSNGRAEG
jgi:uncharacterized protein